MAKNNFDTVGIIPYALDGEGVLHFGMSLSLPGENKTGTKKDQLVMDALVSTKRPSYKTIKSVEVISSSAAVEIKDEDEDAAALRLIRGMSSDLGTQMTVEDTKVCQKQRFSSTGYMVYFVRLANIEDLIECVKPVDSKAYYKEREAKFAEDDKRWEDIYMRTNQPDTCREYKVTSVEDVSWSKILTYDQMVNYSCIRRLDKKILLGKIRLLQDPKLADLLQNVPDSLLSIPHGSDVKGDLLIPYLLNKKQALLSEAKDIIYFFLDCTTKVSPENAADIPSGAMVDDHDEGATSVPPDHHSIIDRKTLDQIIAKYSDDWVDHFGNKPDSPTEAKASGVACITTFEESAGIPESYAKWIRSIERAERHVQPLRVVLEERTFCCTYREALPYYTNDLLKIKKEANRQNRGTVYSYKLTLVNDRDRKVTYEVDYKPVAMALERFFNLGHPYAEELRSLAASSGSFICQEKKDGHIFTVYCHGGKWHVKTNSEVSLPPADSKASSDGIGWACSAVKLLRNSGLMAHGARKIFDECWATTGLAPLDQQPTKLPDKIIVDSTADARKPHSSWANSLHDPAVVSKVLDDGIVHDWSSIIDRIKYRDQPRIAFYAKAKPCSGTHKTESTFFHTCESEPKVAIDRSWKSAIDHETYLKSGAARAPCCNKVEKDADQQPSTDLGNTTRQLKRPYYKFKSMSAPRVEELKQIVKAQNGKFVVGPDPLNEVEAFATGEWPPQTHHSPVVKDKLKEQLDATLKSLRESKELLLSAGNTEKVPCKDQALSKSFDEYVKPDPTIIWKEDRVEKKLCREPTYVAEAIVESVDLLVDDKVVSHWDRKLPATDGEPKKEFTVKVGDADKQCKFNPFLDEASCDIQIDAVRCTESCKLPKLSKTLDPTKIYVFEITHPDARIVVPYMEPGITHITTRDKITLKEDLDHDVGIPRPKVFPELCGSRSTSAAVQAAAKIPWYRGEGFILLYGQDKKDSNQGYYNGRSYLREKVKSQSYCREHELINENGDRTDAVIREYLIDKWLDGDEEFVRSLSLHPELTSSTGTDGKADKLVIAIESFIKKVTSFSVPADDADSIKDTPEVARLILTQQTLNKTRRGGGTDAAMVDILRRFGVGNRVDVPVPDREEVMSILREKKGGKPMGKKIIQAIFV
jgi:hypothetical protein